MQLFIVCCIIHSYCKYLHERQKRAPVLVKRQAPSTFINPWSCLLFSNKRKALEITDSLLLVLSSQPLCYRLLVAIAELELLVHEAVFLQELSHTSFGNVLNHRHLQLSLTFHLGGLNHLAGLVSLLLGEPAFVDVRLDMVFGVNEIRIDAGLLQFILSEFLHLLQRSFLEGSFVFF